MFGAFGILIAVLCGLLLYDEPLQPYDALMPTTASIPESGTNGYTFLREKWDQPVSPELKDQKTISLLLSGDTWEESKVSKLLEGKESFQEHLALALAMPSWRAPLDNETFFNQTSLPKWMPVGLRVLSLKALDLARSGDIQSAVAIAAQIHLLAERQFAAVQDAISFLIADLNEKACADLVCELLALGTVTDAEAAEMMQFWRNPKLTREVMIQMSHGEASCMRSILKELKDPTGRSIGTFRPDRSPVFFLKYNKTLNTLHSIHRDLDSHWLKPFPKWIDSPFYALGKSYYSHGLSEYLNPNFTGRRLLSVHVSTLCRVIRGHGVKPLFTQRAMLVRLAAYRWQLKNPDVSLKSLSELVPDWIPDIPDDPRSGNALLWDEHTKTIYTVNERGIAVVPDFQTSARVDSRTWFSHMTGDYYADGLRFFKNPPPAVVPPADLPK